MEEVEATHHGGLLHEGHLRVAPRTSAHFSADLNQNLAHDALDVLASADRIDQHHLGRRPDMFVQQCLDLIVVLCFLHFSRQQQHHHLHVVACQCIGQYVRPIFEAWTLDLEVAGFLNWVVVVLSGLDELSF